MKFKDDLRVAWHKSRALCFCCKNRLVNNKKYKSLSAFKDEYSGKRCFILCTGPSLTVSDLEKLKDEYTFGMNSICLCYEKTDFRTKFYGIQDKGVFDKIGDKIESIKDIPVFVSNDISDAAVSQSNWQIFPLNIYYHSCELYVRGENFCKFSDDITKVVYDGYSITYSLIQIAVYMGFTEIYLLGADCNFERGKPLHFIEHGHTPANVYSSFEKLMVSYGEAKEYCDSHGVKIYNATRGGKLEIFPRVDLDEVLEKKPEN